MFKLKTLFHVGGQRKHTGHSVERQLKGKTKTIVTDKNRIDERERNDSKTD